MPPSVESEVYISCVRIYVEHTIYNKQTVLHYTSMHAHICIYPYKHRHKHTQPHYPLKTGDQHKPVLIISFKKSLFQMNTRRRNVCS